MDWKKILSELLRQSPLATLLAFAIFTNYRGLWLFNSAHESYVKQCEADKVALKQRADDFADIAFRGVSAVRQQAAEEITKSESRPSPSPANGQSLRAVPSPPAITSTEKAEVKAPIRSNDPSTLNRTLDASQKVLTKTKDNN